jgi:hypothetical protein
MLINNELAKNDYQALRQLEKEFFYFNSKKNAAYSKIK